MGAIERFLGKQACQGWTSKIYLDYIKYKAGFLIIGVGDEATLAWAERKIWQANRDMELKLKSLKGDLIPRPRMATMFLPKAEGMTEEEILGALQSSNEVNTKEWTVLSCAKEGKGMLLKVSVDVAEQERIAELNHTLRFLFTRTEVHGLKMVQKSAAPVETSVSLPTQAGPSAAMPGPSARFQVGNRRGDNNIKAGT